MPAPPRSVKDDPSFTSACTQGDAVVPNDEEPSTRAPGVTLNRALGDQRACAYADASVMSSS